MTHPVSPFKPQEQHVEVGVGRGIQREHISEIMDAISGELLGKLIEPEVGENRNSCDDRICLDYGRGRSRETEDWEVTHLTCHSVIPTSPNSVETLLRRLADDVAGVYGGSPGAQFIAFTENSGIVVQGRQVKRACRNTPKTITRENLIWREGA